MCALFVPLSQPLTSAADSASPRGEGWTIERAEALLGSLTGVVSVRIVAKSDGAIDEIHVLTTDEVAPKQTVRNVESALQASYDLEVDHRKISVAQQAQAPAPAVEPPPAAPAQAAPARSAPEVAEVTQVVEAPREPTLVSALPAPAHDRRILLAGHQVESERAHRVRMRVAVEWGGARYSGDSEGPDLPRPRMESLARASLKAVETAVVPEVLERRGRGFELSLDGVSEFEAFDKTFVLVAVHALSGDEVTTLSGTAPVRASRDKAVIHATLQATDRWVRGRL